MAKRKHSRTTQKQRQKQTQIVNIRLGESPKKKRSSRRKRRQPTMEDIAKADYIQPQQMPLVVFQSGYGSGPLTQSQPQQQQQPFYMMPPQPRTIRLVPEDIGQVGTEGRVEILDQPTRREQLAELTSPVSLPIPAEQKAQQFNPMANIGEFQFGVQPVAEQIPMGELAEPFFRTGSKGYYIQKIKEMTGRELKPNDTTLKELKYTYKMLKGGKQK